jgi:hypothetical protein
MCETATAVWNRQKVCIKSDDFRKNSYEENIWPNKQCRTEGGFGGFKHPNRNSESLAKAEQSSQFRGIYILKNQIRIWDLFICKLSGTPD